MVKREITKSTTFRSGVGAFDAKAFSDAVVQLYTAKVRPSEVKTKKSFSPSTIGYGHGTCPRYWHLAFSGVYFDETTDEVGVANMENGSYVHDRLQKMFEESDLEVELEREILNDLPPIRGFADLIVKWDGQDVVGEIKSAKDEIFAIRKVTRQGTPYHVLQLLIYMKVLGLQDGFLFYENKNTQEFVVIPVSMTENNVKIVDRAFDWMTLVYENWKSEESKLPERPFKKSAPACKNCPIRQECYENYEMGDVEIPQLVIK